MYICMLYIYEYIRTVYSVCIMYVCMYVCMYVYMYSMYVCMYHVISIKKFYFSNGLLILAGVAKMEESVLMLASFEKTTDHLFDAAVHSRQVRCTWSVK